MTAAEGFKYIIISGATASGKTSTSIEVAKFLKEKHKEKCEIINFDSLLFYKELNIGTAKPSQEQREGIRHHLIDISSVQHPINASMFVNLARGTLNDFIARKVIPIFVGGSAFYIRALIKGMISSYREVTAVDIDDDLSQINCIKECRSKLIEYLEKYDPEIFCHFHRNDTYRLTRAAEYFFFNCKKYSTEISKSKINKPYDFMYNNKIPGEMLHIYLEIEKKTHQSIMIERVEQMIHSGLIDEVRNILSKGFCQNLKPLNSIGYKETIKFLESPKECSVEDLKQNIFISTRRLAKSQKTFFRKITPKLQICPLTDKQNLFKIVDKFID